MSNTATAASVAELMDSAAKWIDNDWSRPYSAAARDLVNQLRAAAATQTAREAALRTERLHLHAENARLQRLVDQLRDEKHELICLLEE